MDANALKMIQDTAVKASGPLLREIDLHKDHVQPDGTILERTLTPTRSHKSIDLETIAEFAKRFVGSSAIWYSRNGIVCLVDDDDRADRVTLSLTLSEQYATLRDLQTNRKPFDQRSMILLLRSTFRDALGMHADLIKSMRRITTKAAGSTDLQRGKSSEGREIAAQVGEAGAPEYLTLMIPVFLDQIGSGLHTVECVFELNEQGPSFQLFPLPAELEKAMCAAEAAIRDVISGLLGDAKVPVYYGVP